MGFGGRGARERRFSNFSKAIELASFQEASTEYLGGQ
jgi:hypothetical protein